MAMILKLWVCVCYSVAELILTAWGFRLGAPTTPLVCKDMFPIGHGVNAQRFAKPYDIIVSQNIYTAAEEVHVTVTARNEVVYPITGLLVEARMADCTSPNSSRPIGTFRLLDGTRYLKTLACDNRANMIVFAPLHRMGAVRSLNHNKPSSGYNIVANSAVSHVINREMGYHKFVWKAPAETVGPVYIRATVVSTKKIFWTNITSQIIRDFSRVAMGQYCHIQQYLDLDMENNIVTETTTLDNPTTNGEERTTTSPISTSIHHDTTRHQHLLNISTNRMRISTPSVDSKAHHSSLPITLLITVFFIMVTLL